MGRSKICLNISYDGKNHQITTYPNEYRSLMHLIYDKLYIEDFGECLGMGKCGTCVVKLLNSNGKPINDFDRNEKETLRKAGIDAPNRRLSCQIIADENIDGLELKISGFSDR